MMKQLSQEPEASGLLADTPNSEQRADTLRQPFNLHAMRWATSVPGLGNSRRVFLAIAEFCDEYGVMWHSNASIARHAQCCTRTVRTHTAKLAALGLIRIVGRFTKGKGQTSNAYVLMGWPARNWMPVSGHPKLGRSVNEDKYERLFKSFREKNFPRGAEKPADETTKLNIYPDSTSDEELLAEVVQALNNCLEALGDWATPENRKRLGNQLESFLELVSKGFPLKTVILPVLRAKAKSGQEIPVLSSWAYFTEPVQRFGDALAKAQKNKAGPTTVSKCDHPRRSASVVPTSDEQPTFRQDITRVLKSAVKGIDAKPYRGDE